MKRKLICIEGVDGIGKSTHIKRLSEKYEAKIVVQPSGNNLVGFLRHEVKFNEDHKPFERQLMHTISHCVDAYTLMDGSENIILDRCHLSAAVYGKVTGLTDFQINLLMSVHEKVYSDALKDKYDITWIIMDRSSKFKEGETDNFEKTFKWEAVRQEYIKKFSEYIHTSSYLFSPDERGFMINTDLLDSKDSVTQALVEIIEGAHK